MGIPVYESNKSEVTIVTQTLLSCRIPHIRMLRVVVMIQPRYFMKDDKFTNISIC